MSSIPVPGGHPRDIPSEVKAQKSRFRFPRWAKFITIIGVVVFLFGSIMLPSLCKAREPANRVKCASNLRQISNALILFANDHQGKFPDQLSELITTEDLTAAVFVCPSSSTQVAPGNTPEETLANLASPKYCSYVYLKENRDKADKALVYERFGDHNEDGMNIVFGDMRVEFIAGGRAVDKDALKAMGIPAEEVGSK